MECTHSWREVSGPLSTYRVDRHGSREMWYYSYFMLLFHGKTNRHNDTDTCHEVSQSDTLHVKIFVTKTYPSLPRDGGGDTYLNWRLLLKASAVHHTHINRGIRIVSTGTKTRNWFSIHEYLQQHITLAWEIKRGVIVNATLHTTHSIPLLRVHYKVQDFE